MNKKNRPVIQIPRSRLEIILEIVGAAGVLYGILPVVQALPRVPETIPVHFNQSGAVDGWGSRSALFFFPVIIGIMYAGLTLLGGYPHMFNYPVAITGENARKQYHIARTLICWLKAEMVWLFVYIEYTVIRSAITGSGGLGIAFLPVILIVILGTTGYYIYLMFKNR